MSKMRAKIFSVGLLAAALLPASVAQAAQVGHASWYALHSRTASGEQMNPSALTAAHRSLPFGSKVLVENLSNGRSVVVRINDRGPFVGGRIIDVSKGAASVLGMVGAGTAQVRVTPHGGGALAASAKTQKVAYKAPAKKTVSAHKARHKPAVASKTLRHKSTVASKTVRHKSTVASKSVRHRSVVASKTVRYKKSTQVASKSTRHGKTVAGRSYKSRGVVASANPYKVLGSRPAFMKASGSRRHG
jgi:rare lipoprotein A